MSAQLTICPARQNQRTKDYSHWMHCNWFFYQAEGTKGSDWSENLFKTSLYAQGPKQEKRNRKVRTTYALRLRTADQKGSQRLEAEMGNRWLQKQGEQKSVANFKGNN